MSAIQGSVRCALVSLACIIASNSPAGAQEHSSEAAGIALADRLVLPEVPFEMHASERGPTAPSAVRRTLEKPQTLHWLTASFAILQAADVITTRLAVES